MKNALIYTVVFAAIQIVVAGIVQGIWMLMYGPTAVLDATGTIVTMTVFSILTTAVFLLAKWSVVSRHWLQTRPWVVLFWCVVAALGILIPSAWLQEIMPALPNVAEEQFDMILKDRWGYLVVGLLAPFAEELVFRGAILRALLRWKSNPWIGIVISALLFALIHMNPAQMPHAFLIGILLGWMYYRTDSIIPGVVYHWVNNTVAYVMYNLYPDPNMTLLDLFGSQRTVLMALGFSLCIFLPALFQLNQRLRK
ncbi:MAG: CPBP family intramembrane metalloprotease [Prevotella sp.]|nr:CPBP family intramembrane metalloprotease [Prevotella sp.]